MRSAGRHPEKHLSGSVLRRALPGVALVRERSRRAGCASRRASRRRGSRVLQRRRRARRRRPARVRLFVHRRCREGVDIDARVAQLRAERGDARARARRFVRRRDGERRARRNRRRDLLGLPMPHGQRARDARRAVSVRRQGVPRVVPALRGARRRVVLLEEKRHRRALHRRAASRVRAVRRRPRDAERRFRRHRRRRRRRRRGRRARAPRRAGGVQGGHAGLAGRALRLTGVARALRRVLRRVRPGGTRGARARPGGAVQSRERRGERGREPLPRGLFRGGRGVGGEGGGGGCRRRASAKLGRDLGQGEARAFRGVRGRGQARHRAAASGGAGRRRRRRTPRRDAATRRRRRARARRGGSRWQKSPSSRRRKKKVGVRRARRRAARSGRAGDVSSRPRRVRGASGEVFCERKRRFRFFGSHDGKGKDRFRVRRGGGARGGGPVRPRGDDEDVFPRGSLETVRVAVRASRRVRRRRRDGAPRFVRPARAVGVFGDVAR